MSTSDRVPDVGSTAGTEGGAPTSPGPDSTEAGTAPTAGSGQNVPDTGPGPAAADINDEPDR